MVVVRAAEVRAEEKVVVVMAVAMGAAREAVKGAAREAVTEVAKGEVVMEVVKAAGMAVEKVVAVKVVDWVEEARAVDLEEVRVEEE